MALGIAAGGMTPPIGGGAPIGAAAGKPGAGVGEPIGICMGGGCICGAGGGVCTSIKAWVIRSRCAPPYPDGATGCG
jgi:hypothetical protein